MRVDVDKLVEDGWNLYYLGKTRVLGPPRGSEWSTKAARLETITYNGEIVRMFYYNGFPWDDYKLN